MSIVTTMARTICEDMGDVWELAFDDRQQQRVCKAPDGSFRDINMPQKGEYIEAARAALRAIKPSDISDGMVEAYLRAHGGSDESVKKALFMGVNDFRRALAAAIAAGAEQ